MTCVLNTNEALRVSMGFTRQKMTTKFGTCQVYWEIIISREIYTHILVTQVQPTGAGEAGKKVCGGLSRGNGQEGRILVRRPRAENPPGPRSGRARGRVPARGRRWACQRRRVPRGGVPGRPGRDAAGQPRGNPGPGRPPLADGTGKNRKAGPVTPRLGGPRGRRRRPRPPLTWARSWTSSGPPPRWRTGSSARGRGCGLAPPPGSRGARGHRDGHGGEVDEDEGSRGRLPPRTRTTRWSGQLGGVGCCGGGRCCGGGGCGGDWATPEPRWPLPPRRLRDHRPALRVPPWRWPGAGRRGVTGIEAKAERPPRLLSRRPRGLDSSAQPARSSARARAARTRGPRGAVLALARRCLLRLAPPRHWVGVSGGGGEPRPAPAPPSARGRGRARARAPGGPVGARPSPRGGGRAPRLRLVLSPNSRPGGSPLNPPPVSLPSFSAVAAEPSGNPLFRGAVPARRGLPRERALAPSGL